MNPTIQFGMHPDAESLTAFAEQLLPAAERDQILMHMATCSRCREVVFLSQKAAEGEQPQPVYASDEPAAKRRTSWFEGWRWAWVPVAALATFVGFAVVQHLRRPVETTQMAVNAPVKDALRKATPPPPPASPVVLPQGTALQAAPVAPPILEAASPMNSAALDELKPAEPMAKRDGYVRREDKEETKQLDEKKSAGLKDLAVASGGASTAQAPGISGGLMNERMTERAKGTSIGGPVALNQLQQNLAQQNIVQQNYELKAQNVPADANKKPVPASAALGAASETVTVQADQVAVLPKPVSAAPAQLSDVPLAGAYHGTLSAAVAKQKAINKIILPSGLGVLASASEASQTIALDTSGALFLSEDGGKNWQAIQSQWTGRALLVRTRPVGAEAGALRAPQTLRFELVNDKLQTWFSYDGKTWTEQSLPLK